MTIFTSLPVVNNDGGSTFYQRAKFFARLRLDGVRLLIETPCYGFWYGENDRLFEAETVFVTMVGSEDAIKRALAGFGHDAEQFAMLMVTAQAGNAHIVGRDTGKAGAARLAKTHGGSTLLPDGTAVAF